ncbi:hypothetical protein IX56_17450 [Paracoccus sanguinis]|uniref:Uncharacterized protein n=2 Tax=Paracoccus sanguinis TaxID=1545044 RepID=A0A099G3Z3_9RHOB|nr:hypothetical protein IX56_17450 [Paracoccus sanguinis]
MCSGFYVRRGRLRVRSGWRTVPCGRAAAVRLFDAVRAEFGQTAARKVVGMVCVAPYRLGIVHEVGTRARMERLARLVASAGVAAPGSVPVDPA